MSRWGAAFRIVVAAVVSYFSSNWTILASQIAQEEARRKRNSMIDQAARDFNNAQKDRLQMFDMSANAPRTLVLGRVRAGGTSVRRPFTTGTHSDQLTMFVAYAGHEIDAFESWYVDDAPVTLDGSGWVNEAPWRVTENVPAQSAEGTLNGSGGATVVLGSTPVSGSVTAETHAGNGETYSSSALTVVSVVGTTVTLSGGPASGLYRVNYTAAVDRKYLRIRSYLGADSQNLGAALAAEYPGKIESTAAFAGIALGHFDLIYSPDVYPMGPPTITAVMRGAKCYDPRLDSTVPGGSGSHRDNDPTTWAWTENPALLIGRYARWRSGLNLAAYSVRSADQIAAANRCSLSTNFALRMPDTSLDTVTLPRHRAGLVIPAVHDKRQALDALQQSMAGVVALVGRELRMRAGQMLTPTFSLTTAWLVGKDDAQESCFFAQNTLPREERWNIVTGKCFDPDQRYQLLPYPAVQDSVLLAAQGERAGEVDMPAVSHIAHGQHLASIEIRRRQASAAFQALCDLQALLLEPLDVGTIDLPDWGITAKTVEVEAWSFSVSEPIGLAVREITDAIFTVDAELNGRDPAPDSTLRQPWEVAQLPAITVASTANTSVDASVLVRTVVSWAAVTGSWIRNGGHIEIQYARADQTLPTGEWASQREPGDATQAIIVGLSAGRPYLFRGRMVQGTPLVRGAWSPVVRAFVAEAPTPSNVTLVPHGVTTQILVAGGTVKRVGGSGAWDAGVYSREPIYGACRLSFRVPRADRDVLVGLNSDPATDAGYTGIDFGLHISASATVGAYESGTLVSSLGSYSAGAAFAIEYDGLAVREYINGILARQRGAPPGLAPSMDSTFYQDGAAIEDLKFEAIAPIQRGNLLDSGSWVSGTSGTQGLSGGNLFTDMGGASESAIVLDVAPDGQRRAVWQATSQDNFGTGDGDGGWEPGGLVAIDHTKLYRFAVWMRVTVATGTNKGSLYLGTAGARVAKVNAADGLDPDNPYFVSSLDRAGLTVNRWYLALGYVLPSNYGTTQLGMSGVWDPTTGQKVFSGMDAKWLSTTVDTYHRAFQYYADTGNVSQFWMPRLDLCDGTEPGLDQLLQLANSVNRQQISPGSIITRSASVYAPAAVAYTVSNGLIVVGPNDLSTWTFTDPVNGSLQLIVQARVAVRGISGTLSQFDNITVLFEVYINGVLFSAYTTIASGVFFIDSGGDRKVEVAVSIPITVTATELEAATGTGAASTHTFALKRTVSIYQSTGSIANASITGDTLTNTRNTGTETLR